jgi:cobalt-zinc-cadmium efflux system outer membrane protein
VFEDGLTEDEAIQTALWNNAAYQELLADLGISRAQLLDAGLITDPQFVILFPLGPKQLEFTSYQAMDAIWLRPIRVRAAELDVNRVSQSMVQFGLDTIRNVRLAHADLLQAQQQADVARDAESLRRQVADLARKRLDAGDISELEVTTTEIDALQSHAAAARTVQDVQLAQHRLRTLLGLTLEDFPFVAVGNPSDDVVVDDVEQLVHTALAMRPDLRAAEIAIEAAGERAGLARRQFMNLDAIYDANGQGTRGFESGPGLRFTVPIFNRNRGGIAIARAQWQKTVRQYVTVRDLVTLEVRTAYTQLNQARENLRLLQTEILPALEGAERLARTNYEDGGSTYFLVLQTTGPYLDARMRESLLRADVRRATAELERSVGMRLTSSPASESLETETSLEIDPAPLP